MMIYNQNKKFDTLSLSKPLKIIENKGFIGCGYSKIQHSNVVYLSLFIFPNDGKKMAIKQHFFTCHKAVLYDRLHIDKEVLK